MIPNQNTPGGDPMVKLHKDDRDIIARIPLAADEGELVAWKDEDGPVIDLVISPTDEDPSARLTYTPCELREFADQAYEIADTAQRASWTPEFVADVRDRYLPGLSEEEVIARLDALANRTERRLYLSGRVHPEAGYRLRAGAGAEAVGRVIAVLEELTGELGRAKAARVSPVREALDRLRASLEAEANLEETF